MQQLEINSLGFGFAGQSLLFQDFSVKIPAGEFVSIVGASGCGKSTLLRIIAGLESPSAGQLNFVGEAGSPNGRPPLGYVFQEPRLLPWRTVTQNVRLPLELSSAKESEANGTDSVAEALAAVGLGAEHHTKLPSALSGGMRMRVSVARALVTNPQIMLLDEPFAALDELSRQQLGEDLLQLWQEQKWTTCFVTHQVAEAVFLSQRVIVLGGQPADIAADITIPFSYPRTASLRESVEFAEKVGEVSRALRATQSATAAASTSVFGQDSH